MPIKIDMDMPEACTDCKFCEYADEMSRLLCRLTRHEFPNIDGSGSRFATCPLKECVYMKKQKAVKIICDEIVDQKYKTWYDKAEAAWETLIAAESCKT